MFILITLRSKKYEKLLTIMYFVFFISLLLIFKFCLLFSKQKTTNFFLIKKDNLKQKETN